MKIKGLVIKPKDKIFFKNIEINKKKKSDVKVNWILSSVCNSERRRYNLTKSANDTNSFIGGHEAIGVIEDETYPNKKYALLPHSNCLTRKEKVLCISCENGTENLCQKMRHAGLDSDEPSGFSDSMYVDRNQLLDISDIPIETSAFLEPLSCVIRSWKLSKCNLDDNNLTFGIVGGGPIGCLHAFYLHELNSNFNITIIEETKQRRSLLEKIFKDFPNINISDNSLKMKFNITVMACSTTSGFNESLRLLSEKGKLILFSGFNDVNYQSGNYLPEVIHRYEFTHYVDNKLLIGSSGYTQKDLMLSKSLLQNFSNCNKIITGKVYGLDSHQVVRSDATIENYDLPALVMDVLGDFHYKHIKVQYFNEKKD